MKDKNVTIKFPLIISLIIILIGCTEINNQDAVELPTNIMYVVGYGPLHKNGNKISIIDSDTLEIIKSQPISKRYIDTTTLDDKGRLWVSFRRPGGVPRGVDDRVSIYNQNGEMVKDIETCAGRKEILFSYDKVFIPCTVNGFRSTVTVIDYNSLDVQSTIDLEPNEEWELMIFSAGEANDEIITLIYLVEVANNRQGTLVTIDPKTLDVEYQDTLIPNMTSAWTITEKDNNFYIFDSSSSRESNSLPAFEPEHENVWVWNPDNPQTIKTESILSSPIHSERKNDTIYTYHGKEQWRAIATWNIETNERRVWQLPDNDKGQDIVVDANGRILVPNLIAEWDETKKSGVYELNPDNGEYSLILEIPHAYRILIP